MICVFVVRTIYHIYYHVELRVLYHHTCEDITYFLIDLIFIVKIRYIALLACFMKIVTLIYVISHGDFYVYASDHKL